ncbi:metallophosphoesterase family protein [Paenibacillus chitinolyticus]|uniref:metallophosphoesterase family protein n=1 Tax=Paenibacillus chitinolyticus TaxID=79263 RepID=UPI0035DC41FA
MKHFQRAAAVLVACCTAVCLLPLGRQTIPAAEALLAAAPPQDSGQQTGAEAGADGGRTASPEETNRALLTFSVLSDIHIEAHDKLSQDLLRKALLDHAALAPDSGMMVLNGDLTDGNPGDYNALAAVLNAMPHPPLHATMGNHEYYRMWRTPFGSVDTSRLNPFWSTREAVGLFTRCFGYEKPYHAAEMAGYTFIFLSGEGYRDVVKDAREDAYLSAEQMNWLGGRLSEASRTHPGRPVFVFLHQPLVHTLKGSGQERGVTDYKAFRRVLADYPQAVLFSGHSHLDWSLGGQAVRTDFLSVGSSSVRRVLNFDQKSVNPAKSESLLVQVYPDKLVIRVREHYSRSWIGTYVHELR